MKRIDDKEDLVKVLKQIKKESFLRGYPTSEKLKALVFSFGKEGDKANRYAWNTPSTTINYQGEEIAVRPVTLPTTILNKARQASEFILNRKNKDLEAETEENRIKREAKTYKSLHDAGYITLDSRQDLIEGENIAKKVMLTTPNPDGTHIIDKLKESHSLDEKLGYLKDAAGLLHKLHYDHNQTWGDSSLVNMCYDEKDILNQYNFGFKPNEKKDDNKIKASNFINLAISGHYRSELEPEEFVKEMLDSYNPSEEVKKEIVELTNNYEEKVPFYNKPINNVYNSLVYAVDQKKINKIKKEINNYLN